MSVHSQYGFDLPKISTTRLEENIAEKIARLNRVTTARDMYDLSWIMRNTSIASTLDKTLIRKLTVLKIWVDTNGMHSGETYWRPAIQGSTFDPDYWLRKRRADEFDLEDIGALAIPKPTADELSESIRNTFSFLSQLDEEEAIIAKSDERDRTLVIKEMSKLEELTFNPNELY